LIKCSSKTFILLWTKRLCKRERLYVAQGEAEDTVGLEAIRPRLELKALNPILLEQYDDSIREVHRQCRRILNSAKEKIA
jgi:hypothetical protein